MVWKQFASPELLWALLVPTSWGLSHCGAPEALPPCPSSSCFPAPGLSSACMSPAQVAKMETRRLGLFARWWRGLNGVAAGCLCTPGTPAAPSPSWLHGEPSASSPAGYKSCQTACVASLHCSAATSKKKKIPLATPINWEYLLYLAKIYLPLEVWSLRERI